VGTVYNPESDAGILWDSIGMDWPNSNPDLSERDTTFPTLDEFQSPFSQS
jgi:dTDP-4-dehydrorhamnose 3,5-epimerase